MLTLPASNVPGLTPVELQAAHAGLLQRFFETNPEYFQAVDGVPPGPSAGLDEINDVPPAEFGYSRMWVLGYVDGRGELAAMASVVRDLFATGVWHIGLFIVATARHGKGDAQAIHHGLVQWAVENGAQWLRLGVVSGNTRAERFWESRGYVEVRQRVELRKGKPPRSLRVMLKPLGEASVSEYLELVPRDRPESAMR